MSEHIRTQLQIALSIISGRRDISDLDSWYYEILDITLPRGIPEQGKKAIILERCEDIVYGVLEKFLEEK